MPQRIHPAANHVTIMRTLDQNSGIDGYNDRKPSKLEQMRADYQKKLLKEKEEKMVYMYEENQRKAMMRLTKNGNAANGDQYSNGAGSPTGGKSVREFFNERRRLEAAGAHVPSIDQHYKQAKGYASPGGWSSRTGSGNSVTKGSHLVHGQKNSAGRDRAQPLAPIQRRTSLATETTGNNNINNVHNHPNGGGAPARSGIPLRNHNAQAGAAAAENPFNSRPTLIKHQPLPPTTNGHAAQGRVPQQPSSLPRYVPQAKKNPPPSQQQTQQHYNTQQRQPQQQQQQHQPPPRQPHPPPGGKQGNSRVVGKPRTFAPKSTPVSNGFASSGSGGGGGSGKLSDFQKWQLEQNQAREERLNKSGKNHSAGHAYDGAWDEPERDEDVDDDENDKENGPKKPVMKARGGRLNRLNGHLHDMDDDDDNNGNEYDDDDGEDDIPEEDEDAVDDREDAIKEQERLLLEQIAAKQREMEKLRKEREQEEEEERKEAALRKKREVAERARQKKLEEERRKEEERQRKQDEEDERQDRRREEQRQKEDEKRSREEEKRRREDERRRQEEERKAAKRQAEEDRRQAKKQQQQLSARRTAALDYDDERISPVRRPNAHDTFRAGSDNAPPIDEKPVAAAGNDASFYMQAAASSDAKGSVGSLLPCRQCGRKFAQDRLKKHQDACVKANKPRKEFNAAMKRVEGTEMAKYAGKNRKPDPPKKKSNWRAKHEEFIESLRYAKKVTEYEKEGKDLRELAPPPTTQNPDLVPCPHCGRTFNETAAERHIPRCQAMKTRPPPMNTRRR